MKHFDIRENIMVTGVMAFAVTPVMAKGHPKAAKLTKPNIIYIMCDDMGYGDLGCYGQPYISTPNIDRMASEGMRFTQAYAGAPVSAPSRAITGTKGKTTTANIIYEALKKK